MKKTGFIVCGIAFSLCLAGLVAAQEHKVNAKDVPAPVTAAAAKAYPNAKIVEWTKETLDGKTFYEAEMKEGQTERDVVITPDGKVDLVEEVIATTQVPSAVQAALKARYPKAVIGTAEKLMRDKDVQYELHVKGAPKKEVVFTPDGKFVKEE